MKQIESIMQEKRKIKLKKDFSSKAYINSMKQYNKMYKESIKNPSKFWAEQAKEIDFFKPWKKVYYWNKKTLRCRWFEGAKLNVSYNCLDRHKDDKIALIWESEKGDVEKYSYKEIYEKVCRFANVLKKYGVRKGDRVAIYLPMIPELMIAMLACARIGAVHSVVFGGFSAHSLAHRINDCKAKILVTVDGGFRKGKLLNIKEAADIALKETKSIKKVIVVKRASNNVSFNKKTDLWWHEEIEKVDDRCEAVQMDAEDILFVLYTSGTTGQPKGVVHTTAGYLVFTHLTTKYIFDVKENDIFWCTADIGWITGHSYVVYGPLSNHATTLMFEGVPNYPKPDRFWEIVEKHKVTIFYTAPTVIRAVEADGDAWPRKHDLSSLRLLGSVGEPINPDVWMWYYDIIGNKKCPIVDTWWQTETGGILITPLPGAMTLKPGSANKPFFGVVPVVLKENGKKARTGEGGYLVIKQPWPAMLRTIYKNPKRFRETYFSKFPGYYLTGDGAKIDKENDFWLMGRIDDVVNISGHRIGTAEVESALVSHKYVSEAAVVPEPHPIKGQALFAFVTLEKGIKASEDIKKELLKHVSREIGPIAKPEHIHFTDSLPKTRSGKIMRRVLKAIVEGSDVGDITTLSNPEVVEKLFSEVKKQKNI